MASEQEGLLLARISSESLREATGRDWEGWLKALDAAEAPRWNHKEIVAWLGREHSGVTTSWWRQSIAVGYEQARGKRAVGETATGFEIGVQRSVAASAAEAWDLLTSRPELWLGEGASVSFDEGERYDSPEASGEIRVVKPGERLRMTWQPTGWDSPATLQLTLTESESGKTAIGAHLEKLPDAAAREAMRERWREALERLVSAAH
jgi:uncharacterized protein YndB with AHSA1/START domain